MAEIRGREGEGEGEGVGFFVLLKSGGSGLRVSSKGLVRSRTKSHSFPEQQKTLDAARMAALMLIAYLGYVIYRISQSERPIWWR
jgi:hypothetical protein